MKKVFFYVCAIAAISLLSLDSHAQIRTPAPSPASEVTQAVGLTEITINYSRPSMRGRTIFAADGLVPFGKIWRTGANAATKISFGDDAKVGGKEVKKGDYAVLTIPNADEWTVNLYTFEARGFGSYVEKEPTVSFTVKTAEFPMPIETFTIGVGDLTSTSASIYMGWDKTMVSIPVEVEVDSKVMAAIDKTLAGPTAGDYFTAGSYLHESGKDLNKALEYVQKATHVEKPRFWQVRREALILADLGKAEDAIKAAKKSMELAKAAGNDDYVRMNEKSIAEWSNPAAKKMKK